MQDHIKLRDIKDVDFDRLHDKEYRLNNFYYIIDKYKQRVLFRMNAVQLHIHRNRHNRNLVLKARQLGMSTFWVLDLLDDAIWNPNTACGIVSYSREHASHIFKKIIGYAIKNLPPWLEIAIVGHSANEMALGNHSLIRVDTTLRGGAYQNALVSEFGKTCARNPIKADEVVTGTLETIPHNGKVTIESTGEGSDGYFYDMVNTSAARGNDNLSELDYKLFFYSWLDDVTYTLEQKVDYDVATADYFTRIEKEIGQEIPVNKRNWYCSKKQNLGDKVEQEYPSTVSEAFMSNAEAYYFAPGLKKASDDGRLIHISPYDALLPVYVAMDIGVNDLTVMSFFQVCHGEVRIFDYYADNNKGVDFYAHFLLKDKPYHYSTIFLPHDAVKRSELDVTRDYASDFRKLFVGTDTRFLVMDKQDKQVSISVCKSMISRFVFNANRVKDFIDHCAKYRKKWSQQLGRYLDEPLHDIESNYGDCLRYTSQAVNVIERGLNLSGAYQKHKDAVADRRNQL